jgi:hypothetical protein
MNPPDDYEASSSFKSYIPSPLGKMEARGKRVIMTKGGVGGIRGEDPEGEG